MRDSAAALDPDLQPAAWNVLRQIVREGPSQAGALAASSGMNKSAMSRHLRELRERGFIVTEPSPDDARVVIVSPTVEATERVTAVTEASRRRYRRFLDTWSADELDDFARLLGRFTDIDRFGEDD
jgi:DNA-binding MarR family transcriptional regulator